MKKYRMTPYEIILVTLNSWRRQLLSVTAYTAAKKYKRQLISFASIHRFFIICIIICCLPFFILEQCAFKIPCQFGETFLGELGEKCRRLRETEGKRLIFIGGSAVAFALDSKIMEKELPGYKVVNYGLYGGLGMKMMLDLSLPDIREGDLIILCPEPVQQTMSLFFDGSYAWQGLDGHLDLLSRIDPHDYYRLLGALPAFAMDKLRFFLNHSMPEPDSIYRKGVFDCYGDVCGSERQTNVMPALFDPNLEIDFSPEMIGEGFLDYLNLYAEKVEKKGGRVWFHFCPVNRLAVKEGASPAVLYDYFSRHLGFPIAGDPRMSVMEEDWFYDTNFHLNASGSLFFTKQLIRDMKAMLLDSSRTMMETPDLPDSGTSVSFAEVIRQEKNRSRDGFYSYVFIRENQIMLMDIHGKADEITVRIPAAIDGFPVTALSANVFQGNQKIRYIVLPRSIRFLEDKAFHGCRDLEEIILCSPSPQNCLVGENLLDGTDAMLIVPEEALSAYKTDYRFYRYANRIFINP